MHAAKIANSPRLQRTLAFLKAENDWVTTRSIIRKACVCAVNSVIAELRENGAEIECRRNTNSKEPRWEYRLLKEPEIDHV